jgi:glycine betaine transporter
VAAIIIILFLVTSADSGTFVLGMFTSNGDQNPSTKLKIGWGVVVGAITIVLLSASDNGLHMLQTISLTAALPFGLVMIFAVYAIWKALSSDRKTKKLG